MRLAVLVAVFGTFCTAAAAAPSLERGEYLVRGPAGCGNCHTPLGPDGPLEGQELAGRLVEENEHFTAIAPNLTPAARIAEWSDTDLGRAIREGLRPDGSLIGPPWHRLLPGSIPARPTLPTTSTSPNSFPSE